MNETVRSLAGIGAGNVVVVNALGSVVLSFTSSTVLLPGTHVDVVAHGIRVVGRVIYRKKPLAATAGVVMRSYVVQGVGNYACTRQIRAISYADAGVGFTGGRKMRLSYIVRLADADGIPVVDLMRYCVNNVMARCVTGCGTAPSLVSAPLDYKVKACWLVAATFTSAFTEYVQKRFPRSAYRFNGPQIQVFDRDSTPIHRLTSDMITGAGEIGEDITDCATAVRLESCDVARCTKQVALTGNPQDVNVPGIVNEDKVPSTTVEVARTEGAEYDEVGLDKDFDKMRFSVTGGTVTVNIGVGQDIRFTSEVSQQGWLYDHYGIDSDAGFIDEDFGIVNGGTDSDRDLTDEMSDIVRSLHKQMSVPIVAGELPLRDLRPDILPGDRCELAFDTELRGLVIDIASVTHSQSGTKLALTTQSSEFIDSKRVEISSAAYARKTGKRGGVS
jgi:hypothetical protein